MRTLTILLLSTILGHAHTTLDLKVAHQTAPLGVDDAKPRLSWRIEGETKGLSQAAYQILVATSADKLEPGKTDLWDSGQVKSSNAYADYAGSPLPSVSTPFSPPPVRPNGSFRDLPQKANSSQQLLPHHHR